MTAGASFRFLERWSANLAFVYAIRDTRQNDSRSSVEDYVNCNLAAEQAFLYIGFGLDL